MTVGEVEDLLALQLGERDRPGPRQRMRGRTGHVKRLLEQRQRDQLALGDRQRHHGDIQAVLPEPRISRSVMSSTTTSSSAG